MTRIEVLRGDITTLSVDAIVNAANTSLLGGGGVDGAIHRKGGPKILEECKAIRNRQGGCATGEAVITSGGNLKAKFVIHTVGPVWSGVDHGKLDVLLAKAYRNSLALAVQHHAETIAFPNISTGIYGFPKPRAAEIAIHEVKHFLDQHATIAKVFFVCFDEENFALYDTLLNPRQ